jgi:type-F conjugative transfer system secretin TraK
MKKNIINFLIISILSVNVASATQMKYVEDGAEFTAEISKVDTNRIKVAGDRVRSVKANENELQIVVENKLGEIYVRPTTMAENKPINLFIITEQNFTYKGLLYPKSIPSEQIIIKNDDVVTNSDAEVVKSSKNSYEQQILSLLKAMRLKNKLEGYQIKNEKRSVDLGDLEMKKTITYKGQSFIGEIFTLKNSTNQLLNLEEKMFFKNGVRAVKIEKSTLLPDEVTEILIIS